MDKRVIRAVLLIVLLAGAIILTFLTGYEGGYFAFFNTDDVLFEDIRQNEGDQTPSPVIANSVQNRLFGLAYLKGESFNPITGTNGVNLMIGGLVYEGLFTLDENWEPKETLALSCERTDDLTYLLTIRPDVIMHDGKPLTAEDCEYSLNLARVQNHYKNRLSAISSVRSTGDYEITISLSRPAAGISALLDIPVMRKNDSSLFPAGTGPYYPLYDEGEVSRLIAHSNWWKNEKKPLAGIELIGVNNIETLIDFFDSGAVDIIQTDPTGTELIGVRGSYEAWEYDTLNMHFIGFNTKNTPFDNANVRRALSHAFDREFIAQSALSGQARPASIPVPDSCRFYSPSAAAASEYSMVSMSGLLYEASFEDLDNDGKLDYAVSPNMREPFTIDLIVNSENRYKVKAAESIAAQIFEVGIDVNVRPLKWNDFNAALKSGDYDLYYGELRLSADFSPRQLACYGGSANPSDFSSEELDSLILSFETNPSKATAEAMYNKIIEESVFAPLLFKTGSIYASRGVVRNINPLQANVFSEIENWTITK